MSVGVTVDASAAAPAGRVLGMDHVQLPFALAQQAAMQRFYAKALGLQVLPCTRPQGLSFLAGSQRIDLVPVAGQAKAAVAAGHVALRVQGVQDLHARLTAQDEVVLALEAVAEGWRFYAKDPAGNTLELLQPAGAWDQTPAAMADRSPPALAPVHAAQPERIDALQAPQALCSTTS